MAEPNWDEILKQGPGAVPGYSLMAGLSRAAPNGLPWDKYRQSSNVEQQDPNAKSDPIAEYLQQMNYQMNPPSTNTPLGQALGGNDINKAMDDDALARAKAILSEHLETQQQLPDTPMQRVMNWFSGANSPALNATGPVSNIGIRG
jgi:hypothetical protein